MPARPAMSPMPSAQVMQASARIPAQPLEQVLMILRDSVLPSERETAVDQLARCDWRNHSNVVEGLMRAAKLDPAPMVRVACVRALARMKVNTVPVVAMVSSLRQDPDIRVRQAAGQALTVLIKQ